MDKRSFCHVGSDLAWMAAGSMAQRPFFDHPAPGITDRMHHHKSVWIDGIQFQFEAGLFQAW